MSQHIKLLIAIGVGTFISLTSCTDEDKEKGCETKVITLPDGTQIEQPVPGTCEF